MIGKAKETISVSAAWPRHEEVAPPQAQGRGVLPPPLSRLTVTSAHPEPSPALSSAPEAFYRSCHDPSRGSIGLAQEMPVVSLGRSRARALCKLSSAIQLGGLPCMLSSADDCEAWVELSSAA